MEEGSVVRLKSGGPRMTVHYLSVGDDKIAGDLIQDSAVVFWMTPEGLLYKSEFPLACLKVVS